MFRLSFGNHGDITCALYNGDFSKTAAEPSFAQISHNNGRLDYIETMEQWGKLWNFSFPKLFATLKLLPLYLTDKEFRYKIEAIRHSYNNECFKRDIMDHQRMVFQRGRVPDK